MQYRSPRAKKVATGIQIASVAALLAGGGAWVATDRAVTLRVDGEQRTVHTHADDVAGVLKAADVKVGERDEVIPAVDAEVRKGDTIDAWYEKKSAAGMSDEQWRQAFETVFLGSLRAAREFSAALPDGGVIALVLSTSVSGTRERWMTSAS